MGGMTVDSTRAGRNAGGKQIIFFLIIVQFAFAVFWIFTPKYDHGIPGIREGYRNEERREAFLNWMRHPSPETRAASGSEMKQLHRHNLPRQLVTFAEVFAIDGLLLCLLWRSGSRTRQRKPRTRIPLDY
jgi:hypothetical protein